MSVIAVDGIFSTWSLQRVVKTLAKTVDGNFHALNFMPSDQPDKKICYIKLMPYMNPIKVVKRIHNKKFGKDVFTAFIPDHVPDLKTKKKLTQVPKKLKRKLKIHDEITHPVEILKKTYNDIMVEVQFKYPGLYTISKKKNHELLKALTLVVQERIERLVDENRKHVHNCFDLTRLYRKKYPHSTDFKLIVETLHKQEDEAGLPHSELSETALSNVLNTLAVTKCMQDPQMEAISDKYSFSLGEHVSKYINSLGEVADGSGGDSETAKVRRALIKMAPYVPEIIHQVLLNHFKPLALKFVKMTIYGEPFLPSREKMQEFLRKFHATKMFRSKRVFNCIKFDVTSFHFKRLMEEDGKSFRGAKLIIRPSSLEMKTNYNKSKAKKPSKQIRTTLVPQDGGEGQDGNENEEMNEGQGVMDEEYEEIDEEQEDLDEGQDEMDTNEGEDDLIQEIEL